MILKGWIEKDGRVLSAKEAELLAPCDLVSCGGEFCFEGDGFKARDKYGIIRGDIPPGTILTPEGSFCISPEVPDLCLEDAIVESVELRKDIARAASLSGGVDSSLIAVLSGLPCICVGVEGSPDVLEAERLSDKLGLDLSVYTIGQEDVVEALPKVISVLPRVTPMDVEIALTGYFAAGLANSLGVKTILTGQAADELFAGYARYSASANLRADLDKDFEGLYAQRERDSCAAELFDVVYSIPYMDERVVRASRKIPVNELVLGDERKIALRKVAEKYLPKDTARRAKKAMQYGSGISKMLAKTASSQGFKRTSELTESYIRRREQ